MIQGSDKVNVLTSLTWEVHEHFGESEGLQLLGKKEKRAKGIFFFFSPPLEGMVRMGIFQHGLSCPRGAGEAAGVCTHQAGLTERAEGATLGSGGAGVASERIYFTFLEFTSSILLSFRSFSL